MFSNIVDTFEEMHLPKSEEGIIYIDSEAGSKNRLQPNFEKYLCITIRLYQK